VNRIVTVPAVGGLFFPQSRSLGIDRSGQSPAVLEKVIDAGTACGSFALAGEALWQLAEIEVATKQVERRTRQIGTERCVERDAETAAYLALPLVERKGVPSGVMAPEVVVERSVVATKQDAYRFGELPACAAWQRGFYGSSRKAFWGMVRVRMGGVWERHFSSFTPIVDFIHALTYVYQGAMAGRSFAAGWPHDVEWISSLWSGDVAAVMAGLAAWQAVLGAPEESDAETSPRRKLAESLGYIRNQQERMKDGEYRQAGLPITTSQVESTIKRINQRVKGTEKCWSEAGSESILPLRADLLSEPDPLAAFWHRRANRAGGERRQTGRTRPHTLSA